jgi:hypothetical protein
MDNPNEHLPDRRDNDASCSLAKVSGRGIERETDNGHQVPSPAAPVVRKRNRRNARAVPANRVRKAKGHCKLYDGTPRYADKPYDTRSIHPISPELKAFYEDERRKADSIALTRRLRWGI